ADSLSPPTLAMLEHSRRCECCPQPTDSAVDGRVTYTQQGAGLGRRILCEGEGYSAVMRRNAGEHLLHVDPQLDMVVCRRQTVKHGIHLNFNVPAPATRRPVP